GSAKIFFIPRVRGTISRCKSYRPLLPSSFPSAVNSRLEVVSLGARGVGAGWSSVVPLGCACACACARALVYFYCLLGVSCVNSCVFFPLLFFYVPCSCGGRGWGVRWERDFFPSSLSLLSLS
ncbi:unnamed protein product, partial [Ascophyllum nodosum]